MYIIITQIINIEQLSHLQKYILFKVLFPILYLLLNHLKSIIKMSQLFCMIFVIKKLHYYLLFTG